MSPAQTLTPSQAPDLSAASFGRSADGLRVALVAENAYAMVPGRDGTHFLATGWRIGRPMTEWTRSDFYGPGGDLADETAFRSKVLEQAQHFVERRRLGRRDLPGGTHALGAFAGRHCLCRGRHRAFDRRPRRLQAFGRSEPQGPLHAARDGRMV